jgi:Thioesterase-like superfamily
VADEEPSPLERMLAVADSGNGASWELDINRWYFINPELTVHLHPHREAAGEWICLDAQTAISTGGAGLATSVLSDLDGPVGWVPSPSLSLPCRDGQPSGRAGPFRRPPRMNAPSGRQ